MPLYLISDVSRSGLVVGYRLDAMGIQLLQQKYYNGL